MNPHTFLTIGSAFLLGATAGTWAPDISWFSYLFIALLVSIPVALMQPKLGTVCIGFLAGALLVLFSGARVLGNHIELPANQRIVEVVGEVLDYPEINSWRSRFAFRVRSAKRIELEAGDNLLISCYECPFSFQRGDTWRLSVKLKSPHGYASPGAYDYEKWLMRQAIHATGYVKDASLITASKPGLIGTVRRDLSQWLDSNIAGDSDGGAVVRALILGDRLRFNDALWSTFRRSGIAHIFAISGLHIGMVWLFISGAVRWVSKLWPRLYLYFPAQFIAGWTGVVVAAFYAALSGWGIPVQRAILMLILFQVNQSFGNQRCAFHGLLLVAILLLLLDPLIILDSSYWMSCYAVLVLIFITRNAAEISDQTRKTGWMRLVNLQLKLNLLMAPLVLLFFSEVSLVAPLVNLMLVPLLGSVCLPTLFLAACLYLGGAESLAAALLHYVSLGLNSLVTGLQTVSAYKHSAMQGSFATGLFAFSLIGLFLLGRAITETRQDLRRHPLFSVCLIVIVTIGLIYLSDVRSTGLADGEFEVHVLDVGQGLSVVVQTANKVMVYDTGARYSNGSTVADSVILPWMQYHGIHKLDYLVISHADNDHIGGMESVLTALVVDQIHTNTESLLISNVSNPNIPVRNCKEILSFSFDGVQAEYLGENTNYPSANNQSCVLKLTGTGGSFLLSGDIERQAEGDLVEAYPKQLKSDLLLVPHHGSKTSSRPIFLETVRPAEAVISSGFLNSYRHPAASIVERYLSRDIRLRNTATSGTLSYYFKAEGIHSSNFRATSPRFWRRIKKSNQ